MPLTNGFDGLALIRCRGRVRLVVVDRDQRIEAVAHRRRQTLGHALRQEWAACSALDALDRRMVQVTPLGIQGEGCRLGEKTHRVLDRRPGADSPRRQAALPASRRRYVTVLQGEGSLRRRPPSCTACSASSRGSTTGCLREGAKSYAKGIHVEPLWVGAPGHRYSPVRLMCSHPSGETWVRNSAGVSRSAFCLAKTASLSFCVFQ